MMRKGGKAADDQAESAAPVDTSQPPADAAQAAGQAAVKAPNDARKAATDERKAAVHKARQRVAVIIPAKDESRRIAATVRSARAIPHVDLVLVVDDGSEDNTQHVAREAGAVVVRHSHNRGKAAAMETGAAVVAMRDAPDRQPRILLFIDGDLGETAVNTAPLVPPVYEGHADLSIALIPPQPGAGGRGIVVGAARRAIVSMTGWTPTQPLSGMRCLTREAFEAATPLAHGWGVETGMTIDLLRRGFRVVEVPCDLKHRPSGSDLKGQMHRAAQYRDVQLAVNARRVRRAAGAVKRTVTPAQKPPQTHR
ncbi:glycosyltransferase family 2 protein [Cellulomonas sp. P5_C6]